MIYRYVFVFIIMIGCEYSLPSPVFFITTPTSSFSWQVPAGAQDGTQPTDVSGQYNQHDKRTLVIKIKQLVMGLIIIDNKILQLVMPNKTITPLSEHSDIACS